MAFSRSLTIFSQYQNSRASRSSTESIRMHVNLSNGEAKFQA
jgi:hypothetical protein